MKLLLYAILRDCVPAREARLSGVEGASVRLVCEAGLAAACSAVPEACVVPSVERAMAYARVVDALHQASAVVPLRYGCALDTEAQVAELLRKRRAELLASLAELEGCVEMGVRVLLHEPRRAAAPALCAPGRAKAGLAYLAGRRACYAEQDGAIEASKDLVERLRGAFARLFVRLRSEFAMAASGRLLSLYFLVRREDEERFRKAFEELQGRCSERLLLSGPWPPYSFAGAEAGTDSIEPPGESASPGQAPAAGPARAAGCKWPSRLELC